MCIGSDADFFISGSKLKYSFFSLFFLFVFFILSRFSILGFFSIVLKHDVIFCLYLYYYYFHLSMLYTYKSSFNRKKEVS